MRFWEAGDTVPTVGQRLAFDGASYTVIRRTDTRAAYSGAVWDWLLILSGAGGYYFVFLRKGGDRTHVLPVPPGIRV